MDPGFTVAGLAELTSLMATGSVKWERRLGGDGAGPAITFHALTPSTNECGPISVPPLTNQMHTVSFLGERGGVLEVHQKWVCLEAKGRCFSPIVMS